MSNTLIEIFSVYYIIIYSFNYSKSTMNVIGLSNKKDSWTPKNYDNINK